MNTTTYPPAFPTIREYTYGEGVGTERIEGMDLRDYFAGQALVGELASLSTEGSAEAVAKAAIAAGRTAEQQVAFNCYRIAEAMIAERQKT